MFFMQVAPEGVKKLIVAFADIHRAAMDRDVERDDPDKMQGHDEDGRDAKIEDDYAARRARDEKLFGERAIKRQHGAAVFLFRLFHF